MARRQPGAVVLVNPERRTEWPNFNVKLAGALLDLGVPPGEAFEVRRTSLHLGEVAKHARLATMDLLALDAEYDVRGSGMTPETARLLAQALHMRAEAEQGLVALLNNDQAPGSSGDNAVGQTLKALAETYVHEHRVIERIVAEAVDD